MQETSQTLPAPKMTWDEIQTQGNTWEQVLAGGVTWVEIVSAAEHDRESREAGDAR